MRGKLFLVLLILISFSIQSQTYTMQNGVFSTCSGTFYDSGGAAGNYSANENYEITFCPATQGTYIKLQFTAFNVEGEPLDFLKIYSGTGTTGTLLGTYGNFSPVGCSGGILSSDPSGCITITFESDNSNQLSGWAATISCSPTPNTIVAPTNSICPGGKPFCADAGPLEFPNLNSCDNVPDAPSVITNNTCLVTAPNPAWYYLAVDTPGRLDLEIEQTTGPGGTGTGLDVDYAIWGPFPNQAAACSNFTLGDCTGNHNCTGNVVDCSYSLNAIETATVPNALVGEIYMVLITNFDGSAGYISMTQTNSGQPGAGATDCSIVCPTAAGTNPTCGNSNGKITISGLGIATSYNITYLDDGVPVAVTLSSNAAGQISINGLNAGNYTNILTNFVGCTTSAMNVVLVSTAPPVLTGIIATTPICPGSNAIFTITGTPNAVVTYNINSGSNQTVTLSNLGTVNATVNAISVDTTITTTVISLSGCNVPLPYFKTVVVNPLPTIVLNSPAANANQTLCINTSITPIEYITSGGVTNVNAVGLPTGISVSVSGNSYTLSGIATQGGVFNYTVTTVGGCTPAASLSGVIRVTLLPTATISYAGTPFCKSLTANQLITLTGTNAYTGGVFSALPTGLSINASTGAIVPSTSIAGTYTVSYLVPASGGCSTVTASTTITITAIPTATISYAGTPFCSTLTTAQSVTLTGTNAYTGGTYTAPIGLTLNAITGAIIPSTSLAGTYSVTYTIPASGGCSSINIVTSVIIKPTPIVTATPSSMELCSGETTAITLNSTVLGTTYTWSMAQSNVNGAQNVNGNTISQTLTTVNYGLGTVAYTAIPTANDCVGSPISIFVKVNPLPEPVLYDGVICINQNTNQVIRKYTFDTGLNDANYDFSWSLNNNPILGVNSSVYEANEAGTYEVVATNANTGCVSFPVTAEVTATLAAQAMVTSGYEAFTETPMVVVTVFGSGDYLYQLDYSAFQPSNVFYNVNLGAHIVRVIDPDGCTNLIENITVIGYPHFFTPNDDGYNDTWNIKGMPDNHPAVINIFDRYGKLIKEISTLGKGWDGTYNGNQSPSSDYWFTIDYFEKNQMKQFRSHFSLKR